MLIRPDLLFPSRPSAAGKPQPADDTEADTKARSELGQRLHERNRKQQEDMQASLAKLKELQANNSPKKAASQRAALLKQRLETLKSIMAKLPPGDYKVMAQELKQIAKELAALSKQLGRSGSSSAPLPQMMQGAALPAGSDSEITEAIDLLPADPETAVSELPEPAQAEDTPEPDTALAASAELLARQLAAQADMEQTDSETVEDPNEKSVADSLRTNKGPSANDEADEKQLRALLAEARKALKEVLAMLKSKHQENDEESRKIFADIEKELDKLDKELTRSALSQTVDPAGDMSSVQAAEVDNGIGSFINISI